MARPREYLVIPVIAGLVLALYAVCFGVSVLLRIPSDLALPWPVRLLGLVPGAYGGSMLVWVFRLRGPHAIVVSTWVTFLKLFGRAPLAASAGRTEPLVIAGPYLLVRHPLYAGVDGLTVGIALLADHPWVYLGALALALWFSLVLAPFEERELRALFGPAYDAYMRKTRRFLPVARR